MKYIVAKINNNDKLKVSYLYKRYNDSYVFSSKPNIYFDSEEQAINFINYNSYRFKHKINSKEEKLYVLPIEKKDEMIIKYD